MKKITASILTVMLTLSMVFSSSVFAAEKTSAWDSFVGLFSNDTATTEANDVGVEYRGHVENKGDFPLDGSWIQGPEQLGTVGEGLRLEAFWIKLVDAPEGLHIKYEVHVQNKGWMDPVEDGALAGTEGEWLRIEAIKISLVDDEGNVSGDYSVAYKGHVQNQGDTEWFYNGDQLGTTGSGLRLEALEVEISKIAPDLTEYEAALAAVSEENYTAASWEAYQEVVEDNVMTEDNVQSEVDAATAIILDAQEDLVTIPVIAGMTATAQKTITVSGAQLGDLTASMLSVAGNTVTAVTPNVDGTVATITLGTNLAPETNVTVTATIDGTATQYTVKYTVDAVTVTIEDQTFDNLATGQQMSLLVNSTATTADYLVDQGYTVVFNVWNSAGTNISGTFLTSTTLGTIAVPAPIADYTAQVTVAKGGVVVASDVATIKIRNLNNNISDISSVTMSNYTGGTDTYTISSGSLVVGQAARITKVVVGYGDAATEFTPVTGGYSLATSNSAVASVSSTSSAAAYITATGLGSADITITAGDVTYTLPITVVGTARAATTVALADGTSTFTALFGNSIASTDMVVVVKDQYGDPFIGTTNATFTTPGSIAGLTLTSVASGSTTSLGTTTAAFDTKYEGKMQLTAALNTATAVSGQTGNVVFRNSSGTVIGTIGMVTSQNNVASTKKLVVAAGSTTNVINTDLATQAYITFNVGTFNSSGVQIGTVATADLANYTVTCDSTILALSQGATAKTAVSNVYTLDGTSANSFTLTGNKAGTTTILVKDASGNVVESRSITVQQGQVVITGVSFLSPSTINYVGNVNYATVLDASTVGTGYDPILSGITTTPSTVFAIRLDVNTTVGNIYLDKDATGTFTAGDVVIGTLSFTVSPSATTTTWSPKTNAVTQATQQGNNGTIIFNVQDTVTTPGTPITVASKGVVVAVPGTDNVAPVLSSVTLASDNANTAYAKSGDTITYTVTFDEAVTTTVNTAAASTVANTAGTVTTDMATTSSATKTIVFTVDGGATDGAMAMSAGDYTVTDAAGNTLTVTAAEIDAAVTTGVTIDTTAPTADATTPISVSLASSPTYAAGDTITIKFSEPVVEANIIMANIVSGTGSPAFDDSSIAASDSDGTYATTFVITLANGTPALDLAATDTFSFAAANVVDAAGNTASSPIVFTLP